MQKEHRQQLVQLVKNKARDSKFDPDNYALQYKHAQVAEAIQKRINSTGGRGGVGHAVGHAEGGGGAKVGGAKPR